jgi:hypothetical protein
VVSSSERTTPLSRAAFLASVAVVEQPAATSASTNQAIATRIGPRFDPTSPYTSRRYRGLLRYDRDR